MNTLTVHIPHVVADTIVPVGAEAQQPPAQKLIILQKEALVVIAHQSLIAIMGHILEIVPPINTLLTTTINAIILDAVPGFQELNKICLVVIQTPNIFIL